MINGSRTAMNKDMSVFLSRQSVRRKRDWKKKLKVTERILFSVTLVLVGFACLYGIYQLIFIGELFSVRKIVVDGKWRYLSAQGVAETSGVKEGDNLFSLDTMDVYSRLSANSWIASMAVRRKLPDTLWIYVEEEKPVAIAVVDGVLRYVNDSGRLFKKVEINDEKDLPVFTGVAVDDSREISEAGQKNVRDMLRLMDEFGRSELGRELAVEEVHYDEAAGYSIISGRKMEGEDASGRARGTMQILIGHTAFENGIYTLKRFYTVISDRPGRIQYILANEPGKLIVKYQS